MKAADVMTRDVITVPPKTTVREVAKILNQFAISAVPVCDAAGQVLGIVSEGDLLHRRELGTERHESWWLRLLTSDADLALDFAKANGRYASEVMTRPVVTIAPSTSLEEAAETMERNDVKRLVVVEKGRIVGILTRADLVRALASGGSVEEEAGRQDQAIRQAVLDAVKKQGWAHGWNKSITVRDKVVHLWGVYGSDEERTALRVLAENVAGVVAVKDHLRKAYTATEPLLI